MATANFKVPHITNEPNQLFAKDSTERKDLDAAIQRLQNRPTHDIPLFIDGKEVRTNLHGQQVNPACHRTVVATYAKAGASEMKMAIEGALSNQKNWEMLPFVDRAATFLKAADLIATKYRYKIMAATMIGQGKNAWQAEIDATAELANFLRFNVRYTEEIYASQPPYNSPAVWNRVEYRALQGFVYAISPFNFTAIGGNLATLPALLGNVVIWKPSDSAILSNWILYQILLEAGLPPNVIQWVPGDANELTQISLAHRDFAALHFTGSTAVFRQLYGEIGAGISQGRYRSYPRIVGETGGKNFHLIHSSANLDNAVIQTVRGAMEYQGQKCSATSRIYAPASIWPEFSSRLVEEIKALKVGDPTDYGNFIGPVIHHAAFQRLRKVIEDAKNDAELELLVGGEYDDSQGYYIQPTLYRTSNPAHKLLSTELFGPITTIFVYDNEEDPEGAFIRTCSLVDETSEYGLTGSIFASDRRIIRFVEDKLKHSAGNFYINCKSTGAVVGQQPFGGGRASGTNDKAGSGNILGRFVNMRSIKEEFLPATRVTYPSNDTF